MTEELPPADPPQQEEEHLTAWMAAMDPVLLASVQSAKDHRFVLKLERDCLRCLAGDFGQNFVEYYNKNSYLRLLIHKVGQYFQMGHQVDAYRRVIVLYRLPESVPPPIRLSEIPYDSSQEEEEEFQAYDKMMQRDRSYSHVYGGKTPVEETRETAFAQGPADSAAAVSPPRLLRIMQRTGPPRHQNHHQQQQRSGVSTPSSTSASGSPIPASTTALPKKSQPSASLATPGQISSSPQKDVDTALASLSIEEKEAAYQEARARIFEGLEEPETDEESPTATTPHLDGRNVETREHARSLPPMASTRYHEQLPQHQSSQGYQGSSRGFKFRPPRQRPQAPYYPGDQLPYSQMGYQGSPYGFYAAAGSPAPVSYHPMYYAGQQDFSPQSFATPTTGWAPPYGSMPPNAPPYYGSGGNVYSRPPSVRHHQHQQYRKGLYSPNSSQQQQPGPGSGYAQQRPYARPYYSNNNSSYQPKDSPNPSSSPSSGDSTPPESRS